MASRCVCLSVGPQSDMQPLKASWLQSVGLYGELGELVKGQPQGWLSQITPVWRWERRACRSPVWLCLIAKGDDGSGAPKSLHSFGTISWMKNTKEYYSYIVYVMFCMSGEGWWKGPEQGFFPPAVSNAGCPHLLLLLHFSGVSV